MPLARSLSSQSPGRRAPRRPSEGRSFAREEGHTIGLGRSTKLPRSLKEHGRGDKLRALAGTCVPQLQPWCAEAE